MSFDIRKKVSRFIEKSLDLRWPEGAVDFEKSSFVVNGVKPLVHVQDDIETAFIWCWSVKDHLIEQLLVLNPQLIKKEVESEIDTYSCLVLCSDVANGLKHKTLRKSRSQQFAKLVVLQNILVSKETTSMIQRLDGKYFITPSNGDCIKVTATIESCNGEYLSDAYECLIASLKAWDEIISKFSNT